MNTEACAVFRDNFHKDLPAILAGHDPETDWNSQPLGSPEILDLLEQGLIGEAVLKAVCNVTGLSKLELRSQSRARAVARPRQVACYLMKELGQFSLPQIGLFLGGRDHTTVMYANRIVREKLAQEDELTTTIYEDAKQEMGL